jgi:hypothetical protein
MRANWKRDGLDSYTAPFPPGRGARRLRRANIRWSSCARTRILAFQPFRDSEKNALLLQSKIEVGAGEMSRISFALLIVAGLMLTAYFGALAWRMSDDSPTDVTGQITPRAK